MVGRRTCDQQVASSIQSTARARLRNDSGQVVHTQLPRRRHSSLVYRVVKLGTFTIFVDKTQPCHRAKNGDGDRTEKKVSVIYKNNEIPESEQLRNTTSTCTIS